MCSALGLNVLSLNFNFALGGWSAPKRAVMSTGGLVSTEIFKSVGGVISVGVVPVDRVISTRAIIFAVGFGGGRRTRGVVSTEIAVVASMGGVMLTKPIMSEVCDGLITSGGEFDLVIDLVVRRSTGEAVLLFDLAISWDETTRSEYSSEGDEGSSWVSRVSVGSDTTSAVCGA